MEIAIIPADEFQSLKANVQSISDRLNGITTQLTPPQHSQDTEQLLSVPEAAEMLRITIPTLYSYINQGKIQAFKIGSRTLFKRSQLLESLDNFSDDTKIKRGRPKKEAE